MEYLTLCGIRLRGDFSEIIRNFRDRGFVVKSNRETLKDGDIVCMDGILYDEICEISMKYSSAYNGFYHINIHFKRVYIYWDLLLGKFFQLKDEMCKQYSVSPPVLLQSFKKKFKQGNNNEMKYLEDANYMATFYLPLFYVELVIQSDATIMTRIHDNIYDETIGKNRTDLITELYK